MDFFDGLPRSQSGNEHIWVIVDNLTKSVHFILVPTERTNEYLGRKYIQ